MKIVFSTSTRADFGKTFPLLEAASLAGNDIQILATSMHLEEDWGFTVLHVEEMARRIGASVIRSPCGPSFHEKIADCSRSTYSALKAYNPDMIVIHGDRSEALGMASGAVAAGVPISHVEGGEVSGSLDNRFRRAISALSDYHFVSNALAAEEVAYAKGSRDHIYVIGAPGLDLVFNENRLPTKAAVKEKYGVDLNQRYALFLLHPDSNFPEKSSYYADLISRNSVRIRHNSQLESLVMIYPNNEPGCDEIIKSITEEHGDGFYGKTIRSVRYEHFIQMMRYSQVLVGNSSAFIQEGPAMGCKAVILGDRQQGRSRSDNLFFTDGANFLATIDQAINTASTVSMEFGKGDAARHFMEAIEKICQSGNK